MSRHGWKALSLMLGILMVAGCASLPNLPAFSAVNLDSELKSGTFSQKTDNFLVILDASQSTENPLFADNNKFMVAKGVVDRMNRTIPPLKLKAGLRSFGHSPAVSKEETVLFYGMQDYSRAGFEKGSARIFEPGGNSPMTAALIAATEDLKKVEGKIAVILVSDGKEIGNAPEQTAEMLKKAFGERLTIYTVFVGDDAAGKRLMERIATIGGGGFFVEADKIASGPEMADFVEKVFLERREKAIVSRSDSDSDGDGIADYLDKCPNTPKGVTVDAGGCPIDSDGDGIADYLDKCQDTPRGAPVNAVGCWIAGTINFDFDKWDVKTGEYTDLDKAVAVLNQNPGLKVEIEGHTDSVGTSTYNQRLSEKRAGAVNDYLLQKGIAAGRLSSEGFGLRMPIATNETEDGRAENRRVQMNPIR